MYFVVRVRCCRKESSRSLSHLLMSFLFFLMLNAHNLLIIRTMMQNHGNNQNSSVKCYQNFHALSCLYHVTSTPVWRQCDLINVSLNADWSFYTNNKIFTDFSSFHVTKTFYKAAERLGGNEAQAPTFENIARCTASSSRPHSLSSFLSLPLPVPLFPSFPRPQLGILLECLSFPCGLRRSLATIWHLVHFGPKKGAYDDSN